MTKTKSHRQLKYIFLLAKKALLSNDRLRQMVEDNFPSTEGHLSRLTAFQAYLIINSLKKQLNLGTFEPVAIPDTHSQISNSYRLGRQPRDSIRPPMSQAQHDNCLRIATEIIELKRVAPDLAGGTRESPFDLLEKLARYHGALCWDVCTTRQAWRVMHALKAIKQRYKMTHDKTKIFIKLNLSRGSRIPQYKEA